MEKIYGIYPGNLTDTDDINQMTGSEIYLAINYQSNYIRNTLAKTHHNLNIDLSDDVYALEYLIYQTKRFGVDLPNPRKGRHIVLTESFNEWYKTYADYFNKAINLVNPLNINESLHIKK